jgi:hypothetical protein
MNSATQARQQAQIDVDNAAAALDDLLERAERTPNIDPARIIFARHRLREARERLAEPSKRGKF